MLILCHLATYPLGGAGIMEAGFAQYLKQFTSSSTLGDCAGKVFLLRNLPDRREPDAEAAAEAAHAGARLVNGLECKLSCSTSKVDRPTGFP